MRPIDDTHGRGAGSDYEATVLLARVRAGEAAAFEGLFDLCASAVHAYLKIVLDDPTDADDATEDVFAEALESLADSDYRSLPVRVWLLRIAHEYARELNAIDAPAGGEHGPKELGVTATLLLTEKSGWVGDEALVSVVSGLPAGPREALVLRQVIGFSAGETAKVLGRTPDQVAMLERSAIDSLCNLLRPFNGRPPLPPERLGVQRRVRESPVACERRRPLASGRRMARTIALVIAALASLPGLSALASEPSSSARDASAYVTDGPVHAVAHEPGGNTYIGGDFDHVGPRSGHGLALGAVGSPDGAVPLGSAAGTLPLLGDLEFPEVAGGEVHAVVSDGHGGWFIGGDFTSVGGLEIPRLAHVFGPEHPVSPGQVDADWRPHPNGAVRALALDKSTYTDRWALYAGGEFTSMDSPEILNNGTRHYLAAWRISPATGMPERLDADPDLGPFSSEEPLDWNPGAKADNTVRALAVTTVQYQVDPPPAFGGDEFRFDSPLVVAGGDFTKIGKADIEIHRAAGIWGEGSVSGTNAKREGSAFAIGAFNNTALKVRALVAGEPSPPDLPATTQSVPVYVGGDFTGGGAPNRLRALQVKIAITDIPGTSAGEITSAFGYSGWTPAPSAEGGPVRALALDETGDPDTLYVGGDFATIAGHTSNSLAAVAGIPDSAVNGAGHCPAPNPCPASLSTWSPGNFATGDAATGRLRSLAVASDGATVYVGGRFTQIGAGTPQDRNDAAALVGSGRSGPSGEGEGEALDWDPSLAGGPVNALALDGDSLYAGGGFFSVGASERDNLAALGPDGALVEEFDTGTGCDGSGCADEVRALELAPDGGQLYVGGAFTTVDDDPSDPAAEAREHLAALNLPIGEVVPQWNPNPDGWVMTLDSAGERLYAGGAFDRIGEPIDGVQPARSRLASLERLSGHLLDWDPNVRCVEPFESCSSHGVYAIEASCDAVYVGGRFDRIGAVAPGGTQPVRTNIARLDPFTAAAAAWNPNPQGNPGAVRALAAHGGTVYAGGSFSVLGGAARQRLAALDATNGLATGWNPAPNGLVQAVAVSGDGQTVFAGGEFFQIGNAERWGLAALNATGAGSATAWDPSVREPDPTTGAPSRSEVKSIAVAGGNVYAGGQFTDVGASAQRGYAQFTSGGEGAAGEPLGCGGLPGQGTPEPTDSMAPSIGQPFVANGGQTLVVALSEAARIHVDLTGSGRGLMPMGRRAACAPDSAKLRSELRRALRATLRNLSARARARKLSKLMAKRACTVRVAPRSIDADGAAGENRISLAGTGPLAPGSYRATVTARDAAGNQAQPVTIDFGVGP